jgi:hypothetical protein
MRPANSTSFIPGLAIWLGFSLVLGYFASLVFEFYKPRLHSPEWSQSVWVEAGVERPTSYYRKHISLGATPLRAPLQVAAPDEFTLYVNGELIAEKAFSSVFTSGVYDIAPYLRSGDNVIAVAVSRGTFPGTASLLVEGYWEDTQGGRGVILSGSDFRSSMVEEWQRAGELAWYSPKFDDSVWPYAKVVPQPAGFIFERLGFTKEALVDFRIGQWLWLPQASAKTGALRRTVNLDGSKIDVARFGVSTTASYSVTINGLIVYSSLPTHKYLDAFDIGPFLKRGENVILVNVKNPENSGQVAMAGWVMMDGHKVDLSSSANWQAQSGDLIELNDQAWSAPMVFVSRPPMENKIRIGEDSLNIEIKHPIYREQTAYPSTTTLDAAANIGRYAFYVILVNAGILWLFAALCRRVDKSMSLRAILDAYIAPQLVAFLALLGLLLARFDVRFDSYTWFSPSVFIAFCIFVLIWVSVISLELLWRQRKLEVPA